jgi:hypothetical protein
MINIYLHFDIFFLSDVIEMGCRSPPLFIRSDSVAILNEDSDACRSPPLSFIDDISPTNPIRLSDEEYSFDEHTIPKQLTKLRLGV